MILNFVLNFRQNTKWEVVALRSTYDTFSDISRYMFFFCFF